jgi:hypothetical protein
MGKRKYYTKSQIIEYWFSDEGFERMFKCHKDLACRLEYDIPHCFACQRTMIDLDNKQKYGNLKNTSENWDIKSNLEKCHIIPLALGGDDHPSNLVLLCKECHKLNPNTDDEDLYWLWMKGVEDSYSADVKNFKQAFKNFKIDGDYYMMYHAEIQKIINAILKDESQFLVVPNAGRSSMFGASPNFTPLLSVTAKAIKKHKELQSSSGQLSLF